jgi:hypothetical protein
MNETISAALRDHADGDIHIERLLDAVHAGARRRARRRRSLQAFGAVVVVAALVGVTGTVFERRQGQTVADQEAADGIPRPPRVTGAADAVRRPAVIGSDPTLFHLDASGIADWTYLQWASWSGGEQMSVGLESGGQVDVVATRSPDWFQSGAAIPSPVRVNGVPADLVEGPRGPAIRWQPMPGVWVEVFARYDLDLAIDFAQTLRFDRVYRCAVPFRLVGLASARMLKCSVDMYPGHINAATVWFQIGDAEAEYQVAVGRPDPISANDTIGGRAVEVSKPTDVAELEGQIRYAYEGGTAYFWAYYGPIDEAVFRSLVTAFTPVPDGDPSAWPSNPLD